MENEQVKAQLKDLYQKRDKYITNFFWLGLKIALIFGVPAFVGAFLGRNLDSYFGTKIYTTILLVVAFFSSWVIVYREYKKISTVVEEIEKQIADIKKDYDISDEERNNNNRTGDDNQHR